MTRVEEVDVVVVGGALVRGCFVGEGLADEVMVFVSWRRVADAGGNLPRLDIESVRDELSLTLVERREIGEDSLLRYRV